MLRGAFYCATTWPPPQCFSRLPRQATWPQSTRMRQLGDKATSCVDDKETRSAIGGCHIRIHSTQKRRWSARGPLTSLFLVCEHSLFRMHPRTIWEERLEDLNDLEFQRRYKVSKQRFAEICGRIRHLVGKDPDNPRAACSSGSRIPT